MNTKDKSNLKTENKLILYVLNPQAGRLKSKCFNDEMASKIEAEEGFIRKLETNNRRSGWKDAKKFSYLLILIGLLFP